MHEISLVRNIFRTLENEFPKEALDRMTAINLRVGLLSNVEPILMNNAFEAVTTVDSPQYKSVKLNIEVLPIDILCDACGSRTRVEQYRFICTCGKPSNHIVQGNELLISGVEFEA